MLVYDYFLKSLSQDHPPDDLSIALKALWWDAKNEWDKAHEAAQRTNNPDAAWVHAYLHRKEGDQFNADYWYSRAGKPECQTSIESEWEEIVQSLIKK